MGGPNPEKVQCIGLLEIKEKEDGNELSHYTFPLCPNDSNLCFLTMSIFDETQFIDNQKKEKQDGAEANHSACTTIFYASSAFNVKMSVELELGHYITLTCTQLGMNRDIF